MTEANPTVRTRLFHRRSVLLALSFSLGAVTLALVVALIFLRPPSPGSALTFDDVDRYAVCQAARVAGPDAAATEGFAASPGYCQNVNRRIATADLLDQDARITGTLVDRDGGNPQEFWASYPHSDAATGDLLRALVGGRTKVTVNPQTDKKIIQFIVQFVLPLVLLANLFAILFYFVQRSGSGVADFVRFGKAGNKKLSPERQSVTTFSDVAGADEAVAEFQEIRDYLVDPESFLNMGALPPKGIMLMGPPGCGKTLLARALAGEANASFFSMSGSEFVESLVGVGAARVRDLFTQARASSPAIIFIDELDAVGRQRGTGVGQGHDEREQTLNEMLVQMDGFSPSEGLVVVAATNRPDILDPALLRAGRFDRQVTVERPAIDGRLAILKLHAHGRRLGNASADLTYIARSTPGFTGADLANLLNEAALLAVREGVSQIERNQLEEAVDRVISGPRRRGELLTAEDKHAIAYHEGAHAITAAALGRAPHLQRLSIVARGRGMGHLSLLSDRGNIVRKDDLETEICIALAGFAVEEMVFGRASTGCEQDVERATHVARDLAGRFGLSDRIGPVRVVAQNREVFLGRDYLSVRDVSQPTLEELDSEVRRIVEEQRTRARSILTKHRAVLDGLAAALASQETLEASQLNEILAPLRSPLSAIPGA